MAIRTFRASDGTTWSAWLVTSTTQSTVPGSPSEWLAFQNEDSTERRRLFEVPPNWETLSDERLELLRQVAEPARTWTKLSPPGGMPTLKRDAEQKP
jgi:hypothetical protein